MLYHHCHHHQRQQQQRRPPVTARFPRRELAQFSSSVLHCLVVVTLFGWLPKNGSAFSSLSPLYTLKHEATLTARTKTATSTATSTHSFPLFLAATRSDDSTSGKTTKLPSTPTPRQDQSRPRVNPTKNNQGPRNNNNNYKSDNGKGLNDELYDLRNQRNGAALAEQRLQQGVQYMISCLTELQSSPPLPPPQAQQRDEDPDQHNTTTQFNDHLASPPRINRRLFPTEKSFNLVIMAYSKISHRDGLAPTNAERLLLQLQDLSRQFPTNNTKLQATSFAYNAVLEAYVKSATTSTTGMASTGTGSGTMAVSSAPTTTMSRKMQQQHQDAAVRCFETILHHEANGANNHNISSDNVVIRPNAYTYNLILSLQDPSLPAWQKAKEWALNGLYNHHHPTVETNVKSKEKNGMDEVAVPDRQTINLLMASYAKVGDEINAQKVLNDLLLLANATTTTTSAVAASPPATAVQQQQQQQQQQQPPSHPLVPPKAVWFHCVLKALAESCRRRRNDEKDDHGQFFQEAGLKADALLYQMETLCRQGGDSQHDGKDNVKVQTTNEEAAEAAVEEDENDWSDLEPDITTYNHVLNVHSQSGNTERAMEILDRLERPRPQQNEGDSGNGKENGELWRIIRPDRITYTTMLNAFATKQKQLYHGSRTTSSATLFTTANGSARSSVISADATTAKTSWSLASSSSRYDYLEQATALAQEAATVFQRMKALSAIGRPNLSPNVQTYNIMLSIWSKLGTRAGLQRATELLHFMQDQPTLLPNSISYTTLIHGWSQPGSHDRLVEAGYRAEQLLQNLEPLPPGRLLQDFSRTKVYNSVITAWGKSCASGGAKQKRQAPDRVDYLLSQLERKFANGQKDAKPDKTTFLCMIDAYAKAGVVNAEERCDMLLQRMEHWREVLHDNSDLEPDRSIYNSILNALAKSCQPGSADKAEEILTMMETSNDNSLWPDIVTYSTVIDCHTKCGEGRAHNRAEEIMRFVEGSYRSGDALLKPNAVFYSAILQAFAKTATVEGAEYAENLLHRNVALSNQGFDYAKPHAIMYNAVMDAIARTGVPGSGPRAEALLDEMISLYEAGDLDLKPTRRSFNAVLLAYRSHGDGGAKAEELLRRMEDLADSSPDLFQDVAPDVVSCNCAIGAITGEGAADRAQALFDRMEERSIQPDGRTYSYVIEAWLKRKDEKGHALAEVMLKQFLDHVESTKIAKERLYEDAVWDVINAYRNSDG